MADSIGDDTDGLAMPTGQTPVPAIGRRVLDRLLQARHQSRRNAGEAPAMPPHVPLSPARAAANAISRAAESLYNLPLQPLSIIPDAVTLAEMAEIFPDSAMFAVVEGPAEALGVVALDPSAVTALIEVQALGRVTSRPVENRRRTRSDAMICAEFVNRMLIELEAELVGLDGFENFRGFRFVSHLDDSRPLLLMLEDVGYRSLRLNLSLGDDVARREVQLIVALPERREMPSRRGGAIANAGSGQIVATPITAETTPKPKPSQGPNLSSAVATASVDLVAILCRRQLRLAEVQGLVPGKLLALPRVSLYDARLETVQGQVVAQGKFGEAEGYNAIRINRHEGGSAATDGGDHPTAPGFSAHALADAPLRPVTGPGSAWQPGYPANPHSGSIPPPGDLTKPDPFRHTVANHQAPVDLQGRSAAS